MKKDLSTILAMHEYTQIAIDNKILYLERQMKMLGQDTEAEAVLALTRRLKRQGFKPPSTLESQQDAVTWLYKEISRLLRIGHHASEQSLIALDVALDDFIRRTIQSYYKEDAGRVLYHKQPILTNAELVEAVQRQRDIGALLAYKVTDQLLRRPFQKKLEELSRILSVDLGVDSRLRLMVYIRNSLVHNKGRVSKDLAEYAPDKYLFNRVLTVTKDDITESAAAIVGFCTYVRNKFDKSYPRQKEHEDMLENSVGVDDKLDENELEALDDASA